MLVKRTNANGELLCRNDGRQSNLHDVRATAFSLHLYKEDEVYGQIKNQHKEAPIKF